MLVKLSGDKYINSDAIAMIEPYIGEHWSWIVYLPDGDHLLTKQQFDELMDCLPSPAVSIKHGKGA